MPAIMRRATPRGGARPGGSDQASCAAVRAVAASLISHDDALDLAPILSGCVAPMMQELQQRRLVGIELLKGEWRSTQGTIAATSNDLVHAVVQARRGTEGRLGCHPGPFAPETSASRRLSHASGRRSRPSLAPRDRRRTGTRPCRPARALPDYLESGSAPVVYIWSHLLRKTGVHPQVKPEDRLFQGNART